MANIDELIKKKCAEYEVNPDVLTLEEIKTLKKEIEAEQRDGFIMDSILDDPAVFSRSK